MKVLVVENEASAQKILMLFLERSGYQPLLATDGENAFAIISGPDAPLVVVFDGQLPKLDGIALCKKVRAAKIKERPYMIMLSSKSGKDDIIAGLDAGADDFVAKPFNIAELLARVRVAVRTVKYQQELQKEIDDNRLLNERNDLLSELISRPQEPLKLNPKVSAAVASVHETKAALEDSNLFSTQDIRFLVSATMLELRLVLEALTLRSDKLQPAPGSYCSCASLLQASSNLWIDLVLEAKPKVLDRCFERSLGRVIANESEKHTFMAEVIRRVAYGMMRNCVSRGGDAKLPLMARSIGFGVWHGEMPQAQDSKTYDLMVEGQPMLLKLNYTPGAKTGLFSQQLEEHDVLADQYPPETISAIPLFNEGVVLTPRFIERIVSHAEQTNFEDRLSVYRPTAIARFFSRSTAR